MQDGDTQAAAARQVSIPASGTILAGALTEPSPSSAVVVFAHGSGSSRLSPRNRMVAAVLAGRGFATLLFDLLTPDEADDRANVFDIRLLADRLGVAVRWAAAACGSEQPIGLFGASTGAAAALTVAAESDPPVGAVVSRGGRPDLAGDRLGAVTSPTLLIVGGNDAAVLDLNRSAAEQLGGRAELAVVPGAGHLFTEEGTLDRVAELAAGWFARYLV